MATIAGIDVGGTFTDLYVTVAQGGAQILKVPSTPDDPSSGLMHALRLARVDTDALDLIVHGTTIATNAVIQRRGARCALITTRGFRDVLELGRRDRPRMYGLTDVQQPLIARDLRLEIDERLAATGEIVTAIDEQQVRRVAQVLRQLDVEAVVVSFLHAYANPVHEDLAARWLAEVEPGWEIVTSHSVCNEYFEFERTSTAAVQGFLQPLIARYAKHLQARLRKASYAGDTLIMQSSGGVVPLAQVASKAANIVRSGPAAGVMAAATLAAEAGFTHVITGDMGGTSFDVAVVIEGTPNVTRSTKLDFRIPLQLPMIDVHTIGAGGGSIASLDRGGILQVGPQSAGASPGPACYGRGGTRPTVTDANVVLGRIDWRSPIGSGTDTALHLDAAQVAIGELGDLLGLDLEATAAAILAVVNQGMAGRTRLLSVEQGLDPRDFALVCFGGAGPLHGAAIMREVGISTMLVPPNPGVLCAMGCCIADLRNDYSQTVERAVGDLKPGELDRILASQRSAGLAQLRSNSRDLEAVKVRHVARMCYRGQIHNLAVTLQPDWPALRLADEFERAYRAEFGNTLGDIASIVVSVETTVSAPPPARAERASRSASARPARPRTSRAVYFTHWTETPIYNRSELLPGMFFNGPAVVEQSDATVVIEPAMRVRVDAFGNLLVTLQADHDQPDSKAETC